MRQGLLRITIQNSFLVSYLWQGSSNYIVSGETNFEIISHSLTSDDFVIIISLSGNTPGIRTVVNELNMKDIPILSITELGKNFLVEIQIISFTIIQQIFQSKRNILFL